MFADAEVIRKSEKPTAISLLGIQYQGCGIDFGMGNKGLKWRGSIVLRLYPHRFSEKKRGNKFVDSRLLKQNVDPSLHRIAKRIMDDVLDTCLIAIDICELLGNSDILQRTP